MTSAERQAVKAGKYERIKEMLEKLRAKQRGPMYDDRAVMGVRRPAAKASRKYISIYR